MGGGEEIWERNIDGRKGAILKDDVPYYCMTESEQ